jgi:hypothetical protein
MRNSNALPVVPSPKPQQSLLQVNLVMSEAEKQMFTSNSTNKVNSYNPASQNQER